LREGDVNTKLFHSVANGRRIKNFIPSLRVGDEIITEQDRKVEAFSDAYGDLLGPITTSQQTIDLGAIGVQAANLQELDEMFTE
jgi:hypothetical protein